MNMSLGKRIFLTFSGLLVCMLGIAAGITYFRGNAIAEQSVIAALENIRTVQEGFETQRFRQLGLISEIYASDPYFSSYISEATGDELGLGGGVDAASIVDLLKERQQELGFDIAMVLNDIGEVIASTDDQILGSADLSDNAIVGSVIESLESATGYWFGEQSAYQVAVVPLADEQNLVGFFLTGLMIDDKFAEDIKNISGSELVLLQDYGDNLQTKVSTLNNEQLQALTNNYDLIKTALNGEPMEIKLDGKVWLASVASAGGAGAGGISVALTSLDEALADFRAIENALLIVTGISILLALPLSLLISRGLLAPVRRLAEASQAAARGDYQQRFETKGSDELARLTASFDTLLSDLREKNDMQGYMADLAKYLPDTLESKVSGGAADAARSASETGKFALLGIDLRRFAKQADTKHVEEVFSILNACLKNIHSMAGPYRGEVLGMIGHKVLLIFKGQEAYKLALSMAGNILNVLMSDGEGIAMAVAEGRVALGTASIGEETSHNAMGVCVYHLERLLQEAGSGQILITPAVHESIKTEFPDFKPGVAQGLVSKTKFYCLKAVDTSMFDVDVDIEGDTLQGTQVTSGGGTATKRIRIVPGMSFGGRYEIISELGAGGMGVVYKARDHELNDLVALKMLKISSADGGAEYLQAMKSEIKLARMITHPAVLRTHDYGEIDGVPYISMEYVRGLTLKYLLQQRERIPYSAGLRIAKQLAAGLQAAHDQGVLHRDIKPENIILEQNGNAKLMDFGIARQVKGTGMGELEAGIVGTPRYAAPEQLQGKPVDERADIYSSGAVIYQMYTGQFPHTAKGLQGLIKTKCNDEPTPPSEYWKDIPPELEILIMSCIAREPEQRLKSAEILLEKLEALRA